MLNILPLIYNHVFPATNKWVFLFPSSRRMIKVAWHRMKNVLTRHKFVSIFRRSVGVDAVKNCILAFIFRMCLLSCYQNLQFIIQSSSGRHRELCCVELVVFFLISQRVERWMHALREKTVIYFYSEEIKKASSFPFFSLN